MCDQLNSLLCAGFGYLSETALSQSGKLSLFWKNSKDLLCLVSAAGYLKQLLTNQANSRKEG